jgi:hypothetical protein
MYGRDKKKGNKYIKQRVATVGNLIVIRFHLTLRLRYYKNFTINLSFELHSKNLRHLYG